MENYDVISKGVYARPQSKNFVAVTNFIFARADGKKYLLLKLKNPRAESAEEINLKVTLLDRKGRVLRVLFLSDENGGGADGSFAFGEKIEVPEECCDFTAKVESVVYDGYVYRDHGKGIVADGAAENAGRFDLNSVTAAMRGKTRTVTDRRLGVPVLVCVLSCLVLACFILITYFRLSDFMRDATGFTSSGVEYIFENGDKTAGSNIIVTGYRGTKRNVLIPEKIDGYTVTEIRENAFRGNGKIKKLKILANASIGGYAFAECKALTSVEISGDGEIALCEYSFKDCPRLEKIEIRKNIVYPDDVAIFGGDMAVKDLYLENYGSGRIAALFGADYLSDSALTNLSVGYLDAISDSFCGGLNNLQNVEIAYIEGESYDIGAYAFSGTALTNLKLPQGIKSVGEYAFNGTRLEYFNADGVESIGEYAFLNCENLTGFTVPESLDELKTGTFSGCSALRSVTFESGENLERIGDYVFSYCADLTDVCVPDSVVYMGRDIFSYCGKLVSATLPYIGKSLNDGNTVNYLFGSEINLKSLTLTKAANLAARAFYGCGTIKEINLNEGLVSIGDNAFYGCTGLKSIVIPASVQTVGSGIFEDCFRLYEVYNLSSADIACDYALAIYTDGGQTMPKEEAGGFTVAFTDGRFAKPAGWYLIDYPEAANLVLPRDFSGVANYCVTDYLFYRENLTSVVIPDTVDGIGRYSFYCCNKLTAAEISVAAPVSEIGERAFGGCSSLLSFELPAEVKTVGADAFCDCTALERVIFYDGVKEIGDSAFARCANLTEIEIPNRNAVNVCNYAFENCGNLKKVFISGGVTSIGAYAFCGDASLESARFSFAGGSVGEYAFAGCAQLTEMNIPDGVTSIGAFAFTGCEILNKVVLPESLETIDDGAFEGCNRLRAVINYSNLKITDGDSYGGVGKRAVFTVTDYSDARQLAYTEVDGVTYLHLYGDWVAVWCSDAVTSLKLNSAALKASSLKVASYAFENNTKIALAELSGVSSVGENAFNGCTALHEVTFSQELTEIGESAFYRCINLSSVNLQDTKLARMGESAFFNCTALTYAALPDTLKVIPARAFYYCHSLADAVIPRSLENIGDEAFYGCTSLLQLHNLSYLSLRTGSTAYGYCAFYALHVFGDSKSVMTFAEKGGYKFANYNDTWYLYSCVNYDYFKKLPESFTYKNSNVASYVLREGAFGSRNDIVIPVAVTAIERGAIVSPAAIYYRGTPAQWAAMRPSDLADSVVYYYSGCIHTDDGFLWTYNASGYPSTAQTALEWTETKKPTCTGDGERTGKCQVCGKTSVEKVKKLYHSYVMGKCEVCGARGGYVQTLNDNGKNYTITSSNFAGETGTFVSANSGYGTYAEITVTATEDLQIFFGCYTSAGYYGVLTVTAADKVIATVNSRYLQEFKMELLKGQSLTFSYSGYGNNGGEATIKYILISD